MLLACLRSVLLISLFAFTIYADNDFSCYSCEQYNNVPDIEDCFFPNTLTTPMAFCSFKNCLTITYQSEYKTCEFHKSFINN